jgi:allantoate deiminase
VKSTVSAVDRDTIAGHVQEEIDRLAAPPFTAPGAGVTRYAFTKPYQAAIGRVSALLRKVGLVPTVDPIGTLVARHPASSRGIGIGSHLDSVRNGGRWDGALGVVTAVELARLSRSLSLSADLHVISWLEEEGSGFGEMLLGSRVATGEVTAADLHDRVRSLDDGRSFAEHCALAGGRPEEAANASQTIEQLDRWIEVHIEQGRVLQDAGIHLGIVRAIAGYVHADIVVRGRADHAGATPMALRSDAGVVGASAIMAAEAAARAAGRGTVATVGRVEFNPGIINVVPGTAHLTLDVRSASDSAIDEVLDAVRHSLDTAGSVRDVTSELKLRQRHLATPLDDQFALELADAAKGLGVEPLEMVSGAAHDTMCLAPRVPSAMLFVPCRDGVSHAPEEAADAGDAALAIQVLIAWLARQEPRAQ